MTLQSELIRIASQSTSNKKKVGAILVDSNGRNQAEGFNYNLLDPKGPCEDENMNTLYEVIHAEVDCINKYNESFGYPAQMSHLTMYITHMPCLSCQASMKTYGVEWEVLKKDITEIKLMTVNKDNQQIDETLKQRGSAYGEFIGNATITQTIMKTLVDNAKRPLEQFELEALHMVAHKMSRIVNGQRTKKDNWHDIAGYAKLAEDLTNDQ